MTTNRSWSSIIIATAFITFLAVGQTLATERPNFSGVWMLVKDKSNNLPSIFEAVDEYLLIVKQAGENSITLSTQFSGHGQTISSEAETFPMDGTTVEKEDKRGVKSKRSFRYAEDQRRLLVDTEKQFTGEVQLPNTNDSETWELSNEGKVLTITITPKAEGGQKQVRVFVKKTQEGA